MDDINLKNRAFAYKLGASRYHLGRLKLIFKEHQEIFYKLAKEPHINTPSEVMPFFYHYDAFLYELSSCFDMTLQYLSEKHNLGFEEKDIGWNPEYKKELKLKCSKAFEIINNEYKQWWFEDLRSARNYITHHGSPGLGVEFTKAGIALFFFDLPRLHQKREMFEQCDIWGQNISNLFRSVEEVVKT